MVCVFTQRLLVKPTVWPAGLPSLIVASACQEMQTTHSFLTESMLLSFESKSAPLCRGRIKIAVTLPTFICFALYVTSLTWVKFPGSPPLYFCKREKLGEGLGTKLCQLHDTGQCGWTCLIAGVAVYPKLVKRSTWGALQHGLDKVVYVPLQSVECIAQSPHPLILGFSVDNKKYLGIRFV